MFSVFLCALYSSWHDQMFQIAERCISVAVVAATDDYRHLFLDFGFWTLEMFCPFASYAGVCSQLFIYLSSSHEIDVRSVLLF